MNHRKETQQVAIPRNTGRQGFLRALDQILQLPHVQSIHIGPTGVVSYERILLPEEKSETLGVNYEGLEPYHIMRNNEVVEILPRGLRAPWLAVAALFNRVELERLVPVAVVTGTGLTFWEWWQSTGAPVAHNSTLFGLPVYADRNLPDTTVTLCAAYSRSAALVDCHRFFKMDITPLLEAQPPATDSVDVL